MKTGIDLNQVCSITLYKNNDKVVKYILAYKPYFVSSVSNKNPKFHIANYHNLEDALSEIKLILDTNISDNDSFIKVEHYNDDVIIYLRRKQTIQSELKFAKDIACSFFQGFKNKELKRKRQEKFKKFLKSYLYVNKR